MKRRKLKLQVQVSLDGFIAGAKGEMDWMTWNWDEALIEYVANITKPVDTIVLGRVLAEGFINHWAAAAAEKPASEDPFAHQMTNVQKIVFTKTLENNEWSHNTDLAKGSLVSEIKALKKVKGGGDIIA